MVVIRGMRVVPAYQPDLEMDKEGLNDYGISLEDHFAKSGRGRFVIRGGFKANAGRGTGKGVYLEVR